MRITEIMAQQEKLTERDFLIKYTRNQTCVGTAKKLGINEDTLKRALIKNDMYFYMLNEVQGIKRLYNRDYRDAPSQVKDFCEKLKKDNLMMSFDAFYQKVNNLLLKLKKQCYK